MGTIAIPSCGLLAGRSRTCDLVLSDPDVSRRHLRLFLMQGVPWGVDLGSANGVVVDGNEAARTRLGAGSRLWLGSAELEVREARGDLPEALRQAWSSLADSPTQALRDLAGAVSCTVRPDGTCDFQWEAGQGLDDLGPLRRCLLAAALEAFVA
jgi:predicted component of type VI protein secretion system